MPAEHNLFIYSKNGHWPRLLEHVCPAFFRHMELHSGRYKREQLFEAARRSRACAYLADDDHGPLALQEILLAGCPTVGVRTGASLVRDGITGVLVERLPPGAKCTKDYRDEADLRNFVDSIHRAADMSRLSVRDSARDCFALERIVAEILASLDHARLA